jgi:hypothetical protein
MWHVVPKGAAGSLSEEWGPASLRRPPTKRIGTKVPLSSSHSARPPNIDVSQSSTDEEMIRGRLQRDGKTLRDRALRMLSVERRMGETSDIESEAKRLISQSELGIERIGKIVEVLDSSQSKIKSLSPVAGSPDHNQGGLEASD